MKENILTIIEKRDTRGTFVAEIVEGEFNSIKADILYIKLILLHIDSHCLEIAWGDNDP